MGHLCNCRQLLNTVTLVLTWYRRAYGSTSTALNRRDSIAFNHVREVEYALTTTYAPSRVCVWLVFTLSRLCEVYFAKHVIQASTASSHRVGKCIVELSKHLRIQKRVSDPVEGA